jgi:hypothetical protein
MRLQVQALVTARHICGTDREDLPYVQLGGSIALERATGVVQNAALAEARPTTLWMHPHHVYQIPKNKLQTQTKRINI